MDIPKTKKQPFGVLFRLVPKWLPPGLAPHAMVTRAINFLLTRNPWAMQRLIPYAHRLLAIEWGKQSFHFAVTEGGLLSAQANRKTPAEVRLIIPREHWPPLGMALLQQKPEQVAEKLRIEGDVGFARTLADIASQMHWDIEADLAQYTGDIIAVRLVQMSQEALLWGHRLAVHLRDNLAEYLGYESQMLTHENEWVIWQSRKQALDAQLARLEQRLNQLAPDSV